MLGYIPPLRLTHAVALKDDDVEGDEGAGVEAEKETKEQKDSDEVSNKAPKEIMPTGRVVGIAKRNWRP